MNFGFPGEIAEIAMGIEAIEAAAIIAAGILALAWLVCNWTDA